MSFHVCQCNHNGHVEHHLRYPGMSSQEAQEIADKINSGMLRQAKPIDFITPFKDGILDEGIQPGESIAESANNWAEWCERRHFAMLAKFIRNRLIPPGTK
jgi:hypothetical protein